MPNLGWLTTMLAVSPKHKWGHASVQLLLETLDRSVLWACKEKENLVPNFKTPETAGGESFQHIKHYDCMPVSLLAA